MIVKFFHFTSKWHLQRIRKSGVVLPNGDTPITPSSDSIKLLWLTSEPDPHHQPWAHGSRYNKTEVRLKIHLESTVPGLAYFPEFASVFNMEESWLNSLDPRGYNKNWWVYAGSFPFEEDMVEYPYQALINILDT